MNRHAPENLTAVISDCIARWLGDISTLPEAARERIWQSYEHFIPAYLDVFRLRQPAPAPAAEACRLPEIDTEIIDYMQHFFSDYQHLWRDFNAVNRKAKALLQIDRERFPDQFEQLLSRLVCDESQSDEGMILEEIMQPPHRRQRP
jgi:hypothetical protein